MKISLVGSSYRERSLPFQAQRSINLYPVYDEQGAEVVALYGTPGLALFNTLGAGAVRGGFSATNGRVFFVSGSNLYEIFSDGTQTSRGSLSSSSGVIQIVENGNQLAISDGQFLFIFTFATNVLVKVTDADFPASVGTVTFIDGYFVVNENNSGRFYISSLYDGLSWAALDFATAESSPDSLRVVISAVGNLWLLGDRTTEIWANTGGSLFPFTRLTGTRMDKGIIAPYSALEIDNTLYWLGQDSQGAGIVYRASGFNPERVSTPSIEYAIQQSTDLTNIRAWSYQQDGHTFYVLTGGGLETSFVYDTTTGLWHERAYNNSGILEQHLGSCCIYAFGKHLVGDRINGNVYEMSLDFYDDNGTELVAERIYTHLLDEMKRIRYNELEIFLEAGVGLQTGQGSNPLITLSLSKDGARTWSDTYTASMGAVGNYQTRVAFRRLGIAEQMTFKVRISDPVKRVLIGSYLV